MTVNTTSITSGPYPGNDVADEFSYTFRIEDKTQLIVYETDDNDVETILTVDTDYTVADIGVDAGGIITRTAGALPTGYSWYIRSDYEETQKTAFGSQGGFFPDVHEAAMDKLTFLIQQINDIINRSMRLSEGYSGAVIAALPDPESLKFLRWKSDLSGMENIIAADIPITATIGLDTGDLVALVDDGLGNAVFPDVVSSIVTDQTITVGALGDFTTITAALEYAEKFKPIYKSLALFTTIQLLSGFVMDEQVFVFNKDLSWIRITSVDAIVTIDRASMTTTLYAQGVTIDALGAAGKTKLKGDGAYPAFCFYNSFAPNIAVLFEFNTTGAAVDTIGFQYKLSRGNFERGAGCTDSLYRGLEVSLGSAVWAENTFWDDSGIGIRVSNASFFSGSAISATGCTTGGMNVGSGFVSVGGDFSGCATGSGIAVTGPGRVSATSVDVSSCQYGLRAINGGTITAALADIQDCTENAVLATDGGTVNIPGGDADNCTGPFALYAYHGGIINATELATAINCTGSALRARYGGTINAKGIDVTDSDIGIHTGNGGIIEASGAVIVDCVSEGVVASGGHIDVTGATITGWTNNGVIASARATVIAGGADARQSGSNSSDDFFITLEGGSEIKAAAAVGGTNIRLNEISIDGMIISDTVEWITGVETPVIYAVTNDFNDITHAVNTQAIKVAGFKVIRSNDNIEVFAVGNADGDVWNYAGGGLAYTPV